MHLLVLWLARHLSKKMRNRGTTSSSDSSYTLVTKGHLTVVAELGFQPFEYFEGNSTTPVGFDVDLITEIAKRLNLEVTYLPNQKF